ncbi:hypothetical protein [Microvirga arsenatis]|uniref:DUF2793 domain-containing protein n=1 Tax=Microvirga arsenatis TaxID=2692265 RepID=A0ABW9YWD7_9HYPH|nr:hypothetical protein [Microvirga arsenatis]NBJ13353.1 hypothetical protein [Microvirga arsenatis]NBJ24137.1 hypothetical protein [Microvirga arsenatis]
MARRIILGKHGAGYRFRVSEPGVDAAAASLDQIIFDADNIPARVAATGVRTVGAAAQPSVPTVATISHGVDPSLCIGVAESTYQTTGFEYQDGTWFIRAQHPDVNSGNPYSQYNGVSAMVGEWVTPFLFEGDTSEGGVQSCGWSIAWTSSSLTIRNYSANGIRVRWAALEF